MRGDNMIDLHIHTNKSDGALTPFDVINEASNNNVDTISITDHDTLDAYTDEIFDYANKNNIKLIPGVEISTIIGNNKFHVLGYNIDITNEKLLETLNNIKNARHIYLKEVGEKLNKHGYILNIDKLDEIKSVTKAHIANDIINNKANEEKLIEEFNHIPSMGEFIETIMNNNCPCYVKKNTLTPQEASSLIKEAGGKAILAHPVAYEYENFMSPDEILKITLDMKADGIEAVYLYIDKYNNLINKIDEWVQVAKENKLLITIGSDFHKFENIKPFIGFTNYKELFEKLNMHIKNNKKDQQ